MADLADVENVLTAIIAQIVYPSGTGQASIINKPCKILRGWPIPANLDADLNAGTINISVYPRDVEQNKTRYPKDWQEIPFAPATLTLTAAGTTVTVGGTPASPSNAAVLVNGVPYIYPVQGGDTLTAIATGLAELINAATPATSFGPVITIPAAKQLSARVGIFGTIIRETRRQKRSFQITFWCSTPTQRDAIVPPVDRSLADIEFLTLPDGTAGRLLYERSPVSDRVQREGLYRRDLFYTVEYATTDTQSAPQIVTERFNQTGGLDPSAPTVKTFSI